MMGHHLGENWDMHPRLEQADAHHSLVAKQRFEYAASVERHRFCVPLPVGAALGQLQRAIHA